jgi:hypothetical protein
VAALLVRWTVARVENLRCTGGDRDQILGLGWGCGGGLQIIGMRVWGCGVVKRRYTCHQRCKICVGVRLVVL